MSDTTNERGGLLEPRLVYEKRYLGGIVISRLYSDGLTMAEDPYGSTETKQRAEWKVLGFITIGAEYPTTGTYDSWSDKRDE